jgi:3-hydroxyacyl-[acyl-carrier-protein] dehydratase
MTEEKNVGEISIDDIKRMIPHRYPFLFIDKVIEVVPNKSAVGIKNVTVNEPHFNGHFPSTPIMPGVIIVEAMAQTAAVLVTKSLNLVDNGLLVYFLSIEKAKFRKPVVPGDVLYLKVEVARGGGKTWKFQGSATVNKKLVAESKFTAMMIPGKN